MTAAIKSARVVIPAFRAGGTIRDCVAAVAAENCRSAKIEIVVVDDGENPDLEDQLAGLGVKVCATGGSGSAAVARNLGAADFTGDVLLFIDSDVVVLPSALEQLIAPIVDGRADAAVGNYSREVAGQTFAAKYKQLYISAVYDRRVGYLRNDFWTALGSIKTATFHNLGGFNQSFKGACGEDGDLGVRLTATGRQILGVPDALGHHRHKLSLKGLVLNDWRKGRIALHNRAVSGGPLSDNKHAGPRDVAAVVLSAMVAGSALLACLPIIGASPLWALPLAASLLAYAVSRMNVLIRFAAAEGLWFSARAFWTMLALDWVRLACVASFASEMKILNRTSFASALRSPEHV